MKKNVDPVNVVVVILIIVLLFWFLLKVFGGQ